MICEPICIPMPHTRMPGRVAARRYTGSASSKGTPNFVSFSPVEMCGCVRGSTSGFTRTLTGAILISLGHEWAGLFSNNDTLSERLTDAGKATGELLWRMPLARARRVRWSRSERLTAALIPAVGDPGIITPFMLLYALHDAVVKPMPEQTAAMIQKRSMILVSDQASNSK